MNITEKSARIACLSQYVTQHKQEEIVRVLAHRTRYVSVVLENVFQAHNASAIIRSSEIFGIQNIHAIEQRFDFKIANSISKGASKWVDITTHKNTATCMTMLKDNGYRIAATMPDASTPLSALPLDHKIALIFGTENAGLSRYAKDHADMHVRIPMYGFTESFNISVSVALCLHDIVQRLHQLPVAWQLSEVEKIDLTLQWYRVLVRGSAAIEKRFFPE